MADEADLAAVLGVSIPANTISSMALYVPSASPNNSPGGGDYVISGVVMAGDHTVAGADVFLADGRTGVMLRRTVANQDGGFEFRNVRQGPWTIYGVDPTATFNGDIYTHVLGVKIGG